MERTSYHLPKNILSDIEESPTPSDSNNGEGQAEAAANLPHDVESLTPSTPLDQYPVSRTMPSQQVAVRATDNWVDDETLDSIINMLSRNRTGEDDRGNIDIGTQTEALSLPASDQASPQVAQATAITDTLCEEMIERLELMRKQLAAKPTTIREMRNQQEQHNLFIIRNWIDQRTSNPENQIRLYRSFADLSQSLNNHNDTAGILALITGQIPQHPNHNLILSTQLFNDKNFRTSCYLKLAYNLSEICQTNIRDGDLPSYESNMARALSALGIVREMANHGVSLTSEQDMLYNMLASKLR